MNPGVMPCVDLADRNDHVERRDERSSPALLLEVAEHQRHGEMIANTFTAQVEHRLREVEGT